jgi:hypothetical protein
LCSGKIIPPMPSFDIMKFRVTDAGDDCLFLGWRKIYEVFCSVPEDVGCPEK